MNVQPKDYVIVKEQKKPFLLHVSKTTEKEVTGTLEHNRAYDPQVVTIAKSCIIANLGNLMVKPMLGSVFGIQIEPFIKTLVHPDWGDVHFFKPITKEEGLAIKDELTKTAKLLRSKGFFKFCKEGNLSTEIRPQKSMNAGMYKYRTVSGEHADIMVLRPYTGFPLRHVILHEAAHGVWFHQLSKQTHVKWVKLYKSFAKVRSYDHTDLLRIKKWYLKESTPVRDFKGSLEEVDAIIFEQCISFVRASTRLSIAHINLLAESRELENIMEYWPNDLVDATFDTVVSDYSTKNVEELFAESFAFWMQGKKLPKSVTRLLEEL